MSRIRTRPDTPEFIQTIESIILNPDAYRGRWNEVFGSSNPLHVELGMGKGQFIAQMSIRNPEINFIGIDMYDELVRKSYEKAVKLRDEQGISEEPFANLRHVRWNVQRLEEMFAPSEVERIYLNFSDPWPKKRHAHRRLTHPNFVKKYLQILKPGGQIHLRTDSRKLFEFSLNTFADMDLKMKNIALDLHQEGTPEGHVFTEYEEKFVEQKLPIYQCEVHV